MDSLLQPVEQYGTIEGALYTSPGLEQKAAVWLCQAGEEAWTRYPTFPLLTTGSGNRVCAFLSNDVCGQGDGHGGELSNASRGGSSWPYSPGLRCR